MERCIDLFFLAGVIVFLSIDFYFDSYFYILFAAIPVGFKAKEIY